VDPAVERRVAGLIGLGLRARSAVVGAAQVRAAATKGSLALAIVAPDASSNTLSKVVPLLRARRVRMIEGPSAAALGDAVGRNTTAVVGITDAQLARGIRSIVEGGDESPERRMD
jgi:ribosomal protein L7Ae-like RNA K-turn-binding protein